MNKAIVAHTLKELSGWLEDSYKDEITEIAEELENTDINKFRLQQLKYKLSTEMLFHPKCLGDVYIPDFIGDGSPFAWQNYLCQIADICQKNL